MDIIRKVSFFIACFVLISLTACSEKSNSETASEEDGNVTPEKTEQMITFSLGETLSFEKMEIERWEERDGTDMKSVPVDLNGSQISEIIGTLSSLEKAPDGSILKSDNGNGSIQIIFYDSAGNKKGTLFFIETEPYRNTGLYYYPFYKKDHTISSYQSTSDIRSQLDAIIHSS